MSSNYQPLVRTAMSIAAILGSCFWQAAIADGSQALTTTPAEHIEARPGVELKELMDGISGTTLFVTDDFERENSASIGGDWTDCKALHQDYFEPLGIYDGGVVVSDPLTRSGNYGQEAPCPASLEEGRIYPGIGCAFMDTGARQVSVKLTWSGNLGVNKEPPLSHVEATPLLYITPGNSRFGFGAWITDLWGKPVVFAGYLGAPVEEFEVIATAVLDEHETGTPRELELRAEKPGLVTVWLDGEQISFHNDVGLNPIAVDEALISSTLHGITVDAHCVSPVSNVPQVKGIESARILVHE